MNVVLTTDSIIERDESLELLEFLLNMYPEAKVYTLAHNKESIVGPVQMSPIYSSFMSNVVKTKSDFIKKLFLIPSAAKTLKLPEDTDLVISITTGFAHGIEIPKNAKHIVYLYSWNEWFQNYRLSWHLFFKSFVNSWRTALIKSDLNEIVCSSAALKKSLEINADVIPPVFKAGDYHFVPDEKFDFNYEYFLVFTKNVAQNTIEDLYSIAHEHKINIKFYGPDDNFEKLKQPSQYTEFLGDHCQGTAGVYMQNAKAVFDLSYSEFPTQALAGLSCGRPVIVLDSATTREFIKNEYAVFVDDLSKSNLVIVIESMGEVFKNFDRPELRRNALKYNGRIFKTKLHKKIRSII